MALVKKDGMRVMSKSNFARKLMRSEELGKHYTLVINETEPLGVFIPYEIWMEIQHFLYRVIER